MSYVTALMQYTGELFKSFLLNSHTNDYKYADEY